jgi:uncharacterized protein (TIGR03000 family)
MYSIVLMTALATGTSTPECHKCHGCYGCYGCGCWGGYGCCGCWGGCYGGYGCYGGCYGCWGGYGAWYGGCYGCYGSGVIIEDKATKPAAPKEEMKEGESRLPTRARLIVELPTDARLYIDNQPMKTPAGRRVFTTPRLTPGQSYYYLLRTETVRNGKTVTQSKRVIVRPGQEAVANFNETTGIEAASAR